MKKLISRTIIAVSLLAFSAVAMAVKPVNVSVKTNKHGMTVEQKNVADRMFTDNKAGSVKHLYVISAYSGDVIIYSTVRNKVTSSGKRLQPKTVAGQSGSSVHAPRQNKVNINGKKYSSNEVMQDDGTYGNSIPYIFWYDSKGIYHQMYPTGGAIIHVSDQPMVHGSVVLNFNQVKE